MDILLADDERVVREGLSKFLQKQGFTVRSVGTGEAVLKAYREKKPDLIILDVMMPHEDGYAVCGRIRKFDSETPVLFLTALETDEDEIRALQSGGDMHVAKSAAKDVFLARIKAVLRRKGDVQPDVAFAILGWRVEPNRLLMRGSSGEVVALREREVAILRWFADHPDEVASRDFLLTRFWGLDFDGGDNALTMAMRRLRAKLGDRGRCLVVVRGSGYALRDHTNEF